MGKVRVAAFGVSLDGYGAGPDQSLENPLGVDFGEVMSWFFPTRFFRAMQGQPGGETGVDDSMAQKSFDDVAAWILGRNMFSPLRGPWANEDWKGWWGDEPPYRCNVFVLTHHARPTLRMKGGTTFHFVTGGIHEALARAREAAAGRDVRIGGGVATVRQYLEARLIDELHLAWRPVLLGRGEALFKGLDLRALGYAVTQSVPGERATHLTLQRVSGT
ncbi:MAG TPA: dihydrofolate reductase family protein [Gammaproteobacteria bacterium]|jgi:dihydrofolate reductase|nr:dihydrofolate reductase family protein [Gammaproteobacteria bacterium]